MKPSIFHGEIPDFPLYKPSESWVKSLSPGHPIALQDPHPFILLCDTDLPRLRVTVATTKQATDVELSIKNWDVTNLMQPMKVRFKLL